MPSDILFIQYWHMETFKEEVGGRLREWTFSPSGLITIHRWVLMHYTEKKKCSMGAWHVVRTWDFLQERMLGRMKKKMSTFRPPEMSKKLAVEYVRRLKKIKRANPWPGGD